MCFGTYERYQVGGDIYEAEKAKVKAEAEAKAAANADKKMQPAQKQMSIKLSVNQQKYLDILKMNPPGSGKGATMALRAQFDEEVFNELQTWHDEVYQPQMNAMPQS